ncbi:MAG: T9SS type A sorting domain-containing protein [Bacteroidia bacterium]
MPIVSATSSLTVVCAGKNSTLTGTGANTYTLVPGNHLGTSYLITPSSSTIYTLTGMASGSGCKNTATVSVIVNALPIVALSSSQDTVCLGISTTLTASGASTYSWSPSASLSSTSGVSIIASPTVTTTYNVIGTDTGTTCTNTSNHTIIVSACSGINTISINSSLISVYPNPNNGAFVIDIPQGNTDMYTIEIRNTLSQIVYIDKIQTNGARFIRNINIENESKGIYSLTIQSDQVKLVHKIIVE